MSVFAEAGRLGVHIDIDALRAYKDGDYVEVDISWTDAITLRDRLDSLIHMMDEICGEGSE